MNPMAILYPGIAMFSLTLLVVIWAGMVEHPALHEGGDVAWDAALLVYYPSRAAFIDMVTSPEYLKANRDRQNGAEKHVILATKTLLSAPFPQT